jgi:hypothetical protein
MRRTKCSNTIQCVIKQIAIAKCSSTKCGHNNSICYWAKCSRTKCGHTIECVIGQSAVGQSAVGQSAVGQMSLILCAFATQGKLIRPSL